jgi:hypothetical protein
VFVKVLVMAHFSDKRSTIHGLTAGLDVGGHQWFPCETKAGSVRPNNPEFANYVVSMADRLKVDTVLIGKGTTIPIGIYKQMVSRLPNTTYLTFDSVSGNGCGPPQRPEECGQRGMLCDRIILTGSEGARWFRDNGFQGRIAQIYQGCRHSLWRPNSLEEERSLQHTVSFLGSSNYKGDGGRKAKLSALSGAGFHVQHNKRIFHEEASRLYYNSGICLNMVCGTPNEGHTPVGITSNRLVRVLTSGGFALSERNTDVAATFEEGNHLATYNFGDVPDLLEKARYWMDRPSDRLEIARRGWE